MANKAVSCVFVVSEDDLYPAKQVLHDKMRHGRKTDLVRIFKLNSFVHQDTAPPPPPPSPPPPLFQMANLSLLKSQLMQFNGAAAAAVEGGGGGAVVALGRQAVEDMKTFCRHLKYQRHFHCSPAVKRLLLSSQYNLGIPAETIWHLYPSFPSQDSPAFFAPPKIVQPAVLYRGSLSFAKPLLALEDQSRTTENVEDALDLDVWMYNRTCVFSLPSAKKWSKLAEGQPDHLRTGNVELSRSFVVKQETTTTTTTTAVESVAADGVGGGDGSVNDQEEGAGVLASGDLVQPDELIHAYRYGKTLVPFNIDDEEAMKYKSPKGIAILGFVKMEKIERFWFMSHVQSVVPAGTAPRNHLLAFSALAQALVDMEACAIARYVKNDEGLGGVKLGALFPLIENVGGGSASNSRLREVSFLFCQLPYTEDVREFEFPFLKHLLNPNTPRTTNSTATAATGNNGISNGGGSSSSSARPTTAPHLTSETSSASTSSSTIRRRSKFDKRLVEASEAVARVDAFIESMDLMGNDGAELFPTDTRFHPIYQRLCQCLAHRGEVSADHITDPAPLPPVDPKMMASMVPDERIMERSAEAARALKEAFEIREPPPKVFGPKRSWVNAFGESGAAAASALTGEDGEPVVSSSVHQARMAVREALHSNSSSATAVMAGSSRTDTTISTSTAVSELLARPTMSIQSVGTIDPVADFQAIIARRDVDLVSSAVSQLSDRIKTLVASSAGSSLFPKAAACLRVLREACIVQDEVVAFNLFLRDFKALCGGGGKGASGDKAKAQLHQTFWRDFVQRDDISLISESENHNAVGVTDDMRKEFLEEAPSTSRALSLSPRSKASRSSQNQASLAETNLSADDLMDML